MKPFTLRQFIKESNRIEGIERPVRPAEMKAHETLLACDVVTVEDMQGFVMQVAMERLRERPGMDVYVGNHHPIPGGPEVRAELTRLLEQASMMTPYELHRRFEYLHAFQDGNGRSGRALWLWRRGGIERAPLGFLHSYYYESLAAMQGEDNGKSD